MDSDVTFLLLGSLRKDDDVNEKVAKKMNLCSFNLHRVYFHPVQFVKCFIELNS